MNASSRAGVLLWLGLAAQGCRSGPPTAFDDFVQQGARILFVGAHPDDETLAGPLLADACMHHGRSCAIALFTRGEGALCQPAPACMGDDLAATRSGEAQAAAAGYHAELVLGTFPNATSAALERPDAIEWSQAQWTAVADPQEWIASVMREFRPDLVLALDPDHGFTGHVEHQIASRYAAAALAAQAPAPSLMHVLNHYDAFASFIGLDPGMPTETWDLMRDCGEETCLAATARIAMAHQSQQTSILSLLHIAIAADLISTTYLDQTTPPRTWPL